MERTTTEKFDIDLILDPKGPSRPQEPQDGDKDGPQEDHSHDGITGFGHDMDRDGHTSYPTDQDNNPNNPGDDTSGSSDDSEEPYSYEEWFALTGGTQSMYKVYLDSWHAGHDASDLENEQEVVISNGTTEGNSDATSRLQELLDQFFATMIGGNGSLADMAGGAFTTLKAIFDFMELYGSSMGMSTDERRDLATQIYNTVYNFASQQYQQTYSQLTWFQQQEYNSPSNQISRLIQAGMNPAWYFGSLSSGNASSSSGGSSSGGQSGVSNMQTQMYDQDLAQKQKAYGMVHAIAEGGSTITGMFHDIASGDALIQQAMSTSQMRPHEVENLMIDNNLKAWQANDSMNKALISGKELDNWQTDFDNRQRLLQMQSNGYIWTALAQFAAIQKDYDGIQASIEMNKRSAQATENAAGLTAAATVTASQNALEGKKLEILNDKQKFTGAQAMQFFQNLGVQKSEDYYVDEETGTEYSLSEFAKLGGKASPIKIGAQGSQMWTKNGKTYSRKSRTWTEYPDADLLTDYWVAANHAFLTGEIDDRDFTNIQLKILQFRRKCLGRNSDAFGAATGNQCIKPMFKGTDVPSTLPPGLPQ